MSGRRVPTVTQVTQTECGLCCCVAVLRHHGRAEDMTEARDALDAGRDGLSARDLVRFLTQRGMRVKSYRVRGIGALEKFTSPVILFWEDQHFLVLERFDGRTAVVMDPAVGRRRISRKELEDGFSSIAISAEPGPEFERRRARPFAEWRSVPLFAEGAPRRIALVALLSLSGYGAVLGIPMLTEWAVDRAGDWHRPVDLAPVMAAVLAVAAGFFAIHLIRVLVLSSVVTLMGRHLMTHTFSRMLALPYRYFTVRQPGELLFRLNSVNSIRDLLSSRIAQGVLDIGTLLCVTVYLYVTEWRLGAVASVLLLLNACYLAVTRVRVLESAETEISHLSKSQSAQLDAIVSISSIKMGGYAREFVDRWSTTYDASLDAMRTRMRLQQGRIAGVTTTTQMFGPIVVLLASLYFVSNGRISLGAAIAVQTVSGTYFALATSVFQTYTEFTEASRYMARLNDIAEAEPESRGGSLTRLPDTSISLENVVFRYTRHSEPVLRGVSLAIEPGSRIALVGPSGSGKSTLGRLICGLYEPGSGTVRFGGQPASRYDRDALRRAIGYIPQEVHLHNRTVLDNLTLGQDLPLDRVREYCAEVGILDFLDDLPMGLHTLVSEMGANFSGGQRQRLAIVRALLQKPKLLVMDEATASLDTVNERRVNRIIEDLGATQVIIAHRLATIRSADRIHVLDRGRVVEQGTHHELLSGDSLYAELYAERTEDPTLVPGERS
ncbi:peptidase domain-containing ABC transporter [Streptomyces castrisilvae]|uniref:Peptidase domain-containing ABC transporter n=1 Tax=Streptomyces castrisilvae TaxID=3033811 RepID=A0ABY9HJA8_9ACTN|nr:peptidase domain-containing ABC transporter [Streptomyces sp. Mut1]WLQ34214.1 peptidase domain-containing ABC transporter [Streptomyces sp. Mut1]